jgi:hypothetical protein
MNMKITRLPTWWTAEEADTVITFLDDLRDSLLDQYGEQIIEMRIAADNGSNDEEF